MATMSSGNVVAEELRHHGIHGYFDAVLTADDVTNVKPDLDILTKTIDTLGWRVQANIRVSRPACLSGCLGA